MSPRPAFEFSNEDTEELMTTRRLNLDMASIHSMPRHGVTKVHQKYKLRSTLPEPNRLVGSMAVDKRSNRKRAKINNNFDKTCGMHRDQQLFS